MTTDEIQRRLDDLIGAVPNLSAPSTTKFRAVEQFLGPVVGLSPDDVYVTYVSKPGNATVRIQQTGADERDRLGVVVIPDPALLQKTIPGVTGRLKPQGMDSALFIAPVPGQGWTILHAAALDGSSLWETLRELFPNAGHEVVAARTGARATLEELIDEWRRTSGYPTERDDRHVASREDLATALSEETLTEATANPSLFDLSEFRRLTRDVYGSPGNQAQINRFLQGGSEAVAKLVPTIRHLLYGPGSDAERLDDVLSNPTWKVYGFSEALATKCLSVVHPDRWIPLYVYRGRRSKKAVIQLHDLPLSPLDESGKTPGQLAVESNDALRALLEPLLPGDAWGQMVFLWWLLTQHQEVSEGSILATQTEGALPTDLSELAAHLLLPEEWLATILDLLRDKRRVIFYGPPGTGKTFVARSIAAFLAPEVSNRMTVQFHPSYAYEDFVEGYRPIGGGEGSSLWYEVVPGPLKRLAEVADSTTAPCVLVIDEINRGNIAKIFGELYYLLEYPDDDVELQYGTGPFRLPENIFIVATMNTSDRSIALLDAALRRRFHFVEFFPDRWPVNGLLRRWLKERGPADLEYVADLVEAANGRLPDRHLTIGPSHFMRPDLDRAGLERIWKHSIIPFIEEQFFEEPERVAEFELAALEADLKARAEPSSPDEPESEDGNTSD